MYVHLVDGTFELFRAYFGSPPSTDANGKEVGAARGLARSMLALLGEREVTHVAFAFDHVIESFRNELFAGYKTGDGIDPALTAVRAGRGGVPRARHRDVADDRVRVRRRARDCGAHFAAARHVERVVIARRTRISRSACRASASCAWIACAASALDERGVHREVRRPARVDPRSGSRSSATARTASRAFPRWGAKSAGAVLARLRAPRGDSRRRSGVEGTPCAARRHLRRASLAPRRRRYCSGSSRRCARTCRSPSRSMTCAGAGPMSPR